MMYDTMQSVRKSWFPISDQYTNLLYRPTTIHEFRDFLCLYSSEMTGRRFRCYWWRRMQKMMTQLVTATTFRCSIQMNIPIVVCHLLTFY
jgi:hypothetical protein